VASRLSMLQVSWDSTRLCWCVRLPARGHILEVK